MFCGMNDKDKKTIILAGIGLGVIGLVYLFFRYVLFLMAPFVVALIITIILYRPVNFLKRKFHIHSLVGTAILLIAIALAVIFFVWYVGSRFWLEFCRFMKNYDFYYENTGRKVCDMCCHVDEMFGLSYGATYQTVKKNAVNMMSQVTENFIPSVMQHSAGLLSGIIIWGGGAVIAVTSVFFMINDLDRIKCWVKNGPFSKWFYIAFGRLVHFGTAYIRTQLIIMGVTAFICIMAFFLIGNYYPVMLGILIGLLDALPLFGTGTVLVPWTFLYLFTGRFLKAAIIFSAYSICYIFRQIMEPRMMGGHMGIHPVIMLVTMYVGIWMFGVLGFVLGPAAYIIVVEIMKYLAKVA